LNTLLNSVGATDIRIGTIVLFVAGAFFTFWARPSDEPMERATHISALIGVGTGLCILVETLNLLSGAKQGYAEPSTLSPHVIIVADVMVGAAFVVGLGAFLASRHTSPMMVFAAATGGLSLFAAAVNTLAWAMTNNEGYEAINGALMGTWEFSRNLAVVAGFLTVVTVALAGVTEVCRKLTSRHQPIHP